MTATQALALDDPRLTWEGAIDVVHTAGGTRPWRMPSHEIGLWHPELVIRASMPAGVRIRFATDTRTIVGTVAADAESSPIDVLCDGHLVASIPVAGQPGFRVDGLPTGRKVVELWLPQFGPFAITGLEVDASANVESAPDARPRWVTYGSSITQCRAAPSPTTTWPAIVSRRAGLNLTCLGYGGQCHLDIGVARLMRSLPASFVSICAGINIYGAASLGPRTFAAALTGFVQVVREGHPVTPLVIASPIWGVHRETEANAVGFTLPTMRQAVAEAVEALRAHGDRHVHYVDGLDLFGPSDAHLLPDDLHPNGAGYALLAERFVDRVATPLFRTA